MKQTNQLKQQKPAKAYIIKVKQKHPRRDMQVQADFLQQNANFFLGVVFQAASTSLNYECYLPTSFTRRLTSENKVREETDFTEYMEKHKETSTTKRKKDELGG